MKGTWLMKDVLEVTTMVKRYHDADLRFVFVVAGGGGEVGGTLGYEPNLFLLASNLHSVGKTKTTTSGGYFRLGPLI